AADGGAHLVVPQPGTGDRQGDVVASHAALEIGSRGITRGDGIAVLDAADHAGQARVGSAVDLALVVRCHQERGRRYGQGAVGEVNRVVVGGQAARGDRVIAEVAVRRGRYAEEEG